MPAREVGERLARAVVTLPGSDATLAVQVLGRGLAAEQVQTLLRDGQAALLSSYVGGRRQGGYVPLILEAAEVPPSAWNAVCADDAAWAAMRQGFAEAPEAGEVARLLIERSPEQTFCCFLGPGLRGFRREADASLGMPLAEVRRALRKVGLDNGFNRAAVRAWREMLSELPTELAAVWTGRPAEVVLAVRRVTQPGAWIEACWHDPWITMVDKMTLQMAPALRLSGDLAVRLVHVLVIVPTGRASLGRRGASRRSPFGVFTRQIPQPDAYRSQLTLREVRQMGGLQLG
jgi:hypothetical protein